MPLAAEGISIKIRAICKLTWDSNGVTVAPRPFHALVYRIKGSAHFESEGDFFETKEGDVLLMPAGKPYRAEYDGDNEVIAIHFDCDFTSCIENYTFDNPEHICAMFQKANDTWSKKAPGYYYKALSEISEIIEVIIKNNSKSYDKKTLDSFNTAVSYIEKNFTSKDFKLKEAISLAYMSDTYFRHLFSLRFGTTPSKYLNKKRLDFAEKLLSSGKYSINAAADAAGFNDVKYFSRVFNKEYGVPPSRLYRHS